MKISPELFRAWIHAAIPDSLLPQLTDVELEYMAKRIAGNANHKIGENIESIALQLEVIGDDPTASEGYKLACKDNARLIRYSVKGNIQPDTSDWYKDWYRHMWQVYNNSWSDFLRTYVFTPDPPFTIRTGKTESEIVKHIGEFNYSRTDDYNPVSENSSYDKTDENQK